MFIDEVREALKVATKDIDISVIKKLILDCVTARKLFLYNESFTGGIAADPDFFINHLQAIKLEEEGLTVTAIETGWRVTW